MDSTSVEADSKLIRTSSNHMKKNSQKKPAPEKAPSITSFGDLQKLVSQPVKIKFKFGNTHCELDGRYLQPLEVEMLRLMLDELGIPPMKASGPGKEPEPDFLDVGFQQKKTRIERRVRGLACFWACKGIQDLYLQESNNSAEALEAIRNMYAPNSTQPILDWLKTRFVDEVMEAIYDSVRESPVHLQKLVNFSSPDGTRSSQS